MRMLPEHGYFIIITRPAPAALLATKIHLDYFSYNRQWIQSSHHNFPIPLLYAVMDCQILN